MSDRLQETSHLIVAAIEHVLNQVPGSAVDHPRMDVRSKLEIVVAPMRDRQALRPLAVFHGVLEFLNRLQELARLRVRELAGGVEERRLISKAHQPRLPR